VVEEAGVLVVLVYSSLVDGFDDIHEISYPKFYQAHLQVSDDCQSRRC
jgi:hypothetical protein